MTLDGELWLARGRFDLTSQICRTTVRMGKLRTFKHFLDPDSMEREWLREQLGGKLASQERLRRGRLSWKSLKRAQLRLECKLVRARKASLRKLIKILQGCKRCGKNRRAETKLSSSSFLPSWRSDHKKSQEWHQIKFMIFDSPSMSSRPVEERWAELKERFGTTDGTDIDSLDGAIIKLVHHERCEGREHMLHLLDEVNNQGGEGLMLRQQKSRYEFKRGTTLYKLKSFYDAEAIVVGYSGGDGRNKGHVGALACQMECGTRFRVGTGL